MPLDFRYSAVKEMKTNAYNLKESVGAPGFEPETSCAQASGLSLGSPSISISFLKINESEKYLVVAGCTEVWLRMHEVPQFPPQPRNSETRSPIPGSCVTPTVCKTLFSVIAFRPADHEREKIHDGQAVIGGSDRRRGRTARELVDWLWELAGCFRPT
jgi:hypothetical protein